MTNTCKRCEYSGERVGYKKVVLTKYILDYVKKQGYLISRKPIFLFLVLALFLIPSVSAGRIYDPVTDTLTITDHQGVVFEASLISDRVNNVIDRGDVLQKVAEFEIYSAKNLNSFFTGLEFQDLGKEFMYSRDFVFKLRELDYLDIKDFYVEECNNLGDVNGSGDLINCDFVYNHSYTVPVYKWTSVSLSDIQKGSYRIGLFVDVNPSESVEWIPEFLNYKVPEWAVWNETKESSLTFFFKYNQTSGKAIDNYQGVYNASVTGATRGHVDCILPRCFEFDGVGDDVETDVNVDVQNVDFTVSFWANATSGTAENFIQFGAGGVGEASYIRISSNNYNIGYVGSSNNFGVATGDLDEWHFHVITHDESSTNYTWYVDGVEIGNDVQNQNLAVGHAWMGDDSSGTADFNGHLDSFGLWSRVLTQSEITDLYNSGSGMECCVESDDPPTWTDIADNQSVTFGVDIVAKFNATDDEGIDTWSVNDSRFTINSTGDVENAYNLSAGDYAVNVSVNDTAGQLIYTIWTLEINKSVVSLGLTASNVTYPTTTNVVGSGCPSQIGCTLNQSNGVYGVGIVKFNYSTNGNENYTTDSEIISVNVSINLTEPQFFVLNQDSDFSVGNNSALDIDLNGTHWQNVTLLLYRNGTLIHNSSTPLYNQTNLSIGYYNFTLFNLGNANYSASSKTIFVNVTLGSVASAGDSSFFSLDLTSTFSIVMIIILFVIAGIMFFLRLFVWSGFALVVIGLVLIFSDFSMFVSALIILLGVGLSFLMKRGNG